MFPGYTMESVSLIELLAFSLTISISGSTSSVLVTMLLTTVGVAAAYHLSQDQGLDPTVWVGAGGLWGLIMGWLCIQWMRQRQ